MHNTKKIPTAVGFATLQRPPSGFFLFTLFWWMIFSNGGSEGRPIFGGCIATGELADVYVLDFYGKGAFVAF